MTSSEAPAVAVYRPGILELGYTGVICKTDCGSYIIKYPKEVPGADDYNQMHLDQLILERQIYERLGSHEGIIPYHGSYNTEGAIKLAYAKEGNLERYILAHEMQSPSQSLRVNWIRMLINTFHHLYTHKVLHQDVKLNNIFVHQNSVRLADFANGAIFPQDADMKTICTQDSLSRVDLLGIGCIMYSIATWSVYNYEYFENNRWPSSDEVPATDGVIYQEIIDKCWRNEYNNIQELYEDFYQLDK
ncbi:hypothetical protein EMCG_06451 [[Emmonsia] crescens]|uniref:Protein kinase domain-containing protein n=1 Tax=[Emmonsia] crescens TaxID=73230 RepID=A0A0G2JBR1_9EURO|nr:hypothetical protein EMCG_06451 [Emmonsia crescens UAMH 3008]